VCTERGSPDTMYPIFGAPVSNLFTSEKRYWVK
jgi:hypothetical protein